MAGSTVYRSVSKVGGQLSASLRDETHLDDAEPVVGRADEVVLVQHVVLRAVPISQTGPADSE